MKLNFLSWLWCAYKEYVQKKVLPQGNGRLKNLTYWRNEIFVSILTIIAPVSIVALIPSIYMSVTNGFVAVAMADVLVFALIVYSMTSSGLTLVARKCILILSAFCLSVTLLYYLDKAAPGLLFLLAVTIFSAIIYSYNAAYYSVLANIIVCVVFGVLIYVKADIALTSSYNTGTWIAVSSNLVLLSIVCAECLNLLLKGLESSLIEKKALAASVSAIIENTDAFIYSINTDLKYTTFNQRLKNSIQKIYHIGIQAGDSAFDFIAKSSPEEGLFWKGIYTEALKGKAMRFERDFQVVESRFTVAFSITPIVENDTIIGLSCFGSDITDRKIEERDALNLVSSLQKNNKDLQQFSYIVSHNLRAPIAKIMGLISIMGEDFDENKFLQEKLALEVAQLDDVVKDINTIVSARNSSKEKFELVNFETELHLITQVLELGILESAANLVFNFNTAKEIYSIKSYIYSILYNLISNAIKYRQPNVPLSIEVKTSIDKKLICLSVKDNGSGIDLIKNSTKIFGLYKRFHNGPIPGKGIGLNLVKTHAESLGGYVEIESKIDEGSTFKVYFPNDYTLTNEKVDQEVILKKH